MVDSRTAMVPASDVRAEGAGRRMLRVEGIVFRRLGAPWGEKKGLDRVLVSPAVGPLKPVVLLRP